MDRTSIEHTSELPMSTVQAACKGDPGSLTTILRHYDSYLNKLCHRMLYRSDGSQMVQIDSYMKSLLQAKLTAYLVGFDG